MKALYEKENGSISKGERIDVTGMVLHKDLDKKLNEFELLWPGIKKTVKRWDKTLTDLWKGK